MINKLKRVLAILVSVAVMENTSLVTMHLSADYYAGGIVGIDDSSNISNCSNDISSDPEHINSGIIGDGNSVSNTNCENIGQVTLHNSELNNNEAKNNDDETNNPSYSISGSTESDSGEPHSCTDDNCECETFEDSIGAKLVGYTLSLNGNIGVNFYMELDESVVNDENAYMLFTLPNGGTKQISVAEVVQDIKLVYGKTCYVFSCEVSSDEMTQEIKAQMFDGNGKGGTEYTYTVRDYAEYIIANTDSYREGDVAFAKALLNYGSASQIFFESNIDDLANKNLSAEDQVITEFEASELAGFTSKATSYDKFGTFAGCSLVLESETTLKAYFKASDQAYANNIKFTINGEIVEAVQYDDYYVLSVENIKAWELDSMYVFEAKTVNAEVYFVAGAMSYAYCVLNAGDTYSDELKQLVCALYEYQLKSEIYCRD